MKKKGNESHKNSEWHPWYLTACFLMLMLMFFFLIQKGNDRQDDPEKIAAKLIASSSKEKVLADAVGEQLSTERLAEYSKLTYPELKEKLKVEKDFAIYFVDEDGQLVQIEGKTCIGSPKAEVAGKPCG